MMYSMQIVDMRHSEIVASYVGPSVKVAMVTAHDQCPDREGIGNDVHTLMWELLTTGNVDLILLDGSYYTFILKNLTKQVATPCPTK